MKEQEGNWHSFLTTLDSIVSYLDDPERRIQILRSAKSEAGDTEYAYMLSLVERVRDGLKELGEEAYEL